MSAALFWRSGFVCPELIADFSSSASAEYCLDNAGAFYTRYIHVARLPAAELCTTAILPFLDSFSWSLRDFCQDGKNTKTLGAFLDSFSWSLRDFCQDGKNTKTLGAFLDSFSWSLRDFCQDGKNKKTCTKQV
ncbi:MAG: hypothetical protein ACK4XG_08190 [Chromatiaceae bacterium]|jgi:beta-glucanase (GH16 family)